MLLVGCVCIAVWEETEERFRMTKPGSWTDHGSGNIKRRRRYSSCTCNSSKLGTIPKVHSILPTVSQNPFNSTFSSSKSIQFYEFPKIHSVLP
jgi:hypothetical protein